MKTPSNLPPGVTDAAIERAQGVTDARHRFRRDDGGDLAMRLDFDLAREALTRIAGNLERHGFVAAPPIEPIDDMLKRSKGDRAKRHVANALNELKIARQFLTAPKKG